jgi:hypothetical protein
VVIDVRQGRVTLKGRVQTAELIPVIERLCLGVDGVVTVTMDLSSASDVPRKAGTDG